MLIRKRSLDSAQEGGPALDNSLEDCTVRCLAPTLPHKSQWGSCLHLDHKEGSVARGKQLASESTTSMRKGENQEITTTT